MIFDIRNIKQGSMDIWEYVSSYCAMATELDAIAPNRVSETEKLQNFMYGLADENIRRTINAKVDGNSGGTLTMALEAISSDLREARRKQASAHTPRERGSSSAGPPVTYSNPQSQKCTKQTCHRAHPSQWSACLALGRDKANLCLSCIAWCVHTLRIPKAQDLESAWFHSQSRGAVS